MFLRFGRFFELWLFAALVALGIWLLHWQNNRLDAASASTLVGALFGGAAVLLGNWINRFNEWQRAIKETAERRTKLTALITAELADVAASLIAAHQVLHAMRGPPEASWSIDSIDLSLHLPREMPFTFSIGAELWMLDRPAIERTGSSALESANNTHTDGSERTQ